MLTPACQELVDATPLDRREGSVKAYVELTLYVKKGKEKEEHTGIAVSEVAGPNGSRRIRQVKNMQLYNVRELEDVVTGILERMRRDVARGQ